MFDIEFEIGRDYFLEELTPRRLSNRYRVTISDVLKHLTSFNFKYRAPFPQDDLYGEKMLKRKLFRCIECGNNISSGQFCGLQHQKDFTRKRNESKNRKLC